MTQRLKVQWDQCPPQPCICPALTQIELNPGLTEMTPVADIKEEKQSRQQGPDSTRQERNAAKNLREEVLFVCEWGRMGSREIDR